jgi:PhzF family phenazine biosynthesis protein
MYQIDAFAKKVFEGNPAAVIPLQEWIADELMQKIAMENNLSETVFFVKEQEKYHIRWFTPNGEVDMCGHATLASAYVFFEILDYEGKTIVLSSKSGDLHVTKEGDRYAMDFPLQIISQVETPSEIVEAFGRVPVACYKAMDYIAIYDDENFIQNLSVNVEALKRLDARGVAVASVSNRYDFVTRFFAPKYGIDEDPVTGSAFTQLVSYFKDVLGKDDFHAKQISPRGGELFCRMRGERVILSGYAVKYLEGTIELNEDSA